MFLSFTVYSVIHLFHNVQWSSFFSMSSDVYIFYNIHRCQHLLVCPVNVNIFYIDAYVFYNALWCLLLLHCAVMFKSFTMSSDGHVFSHSPVM